MERFQISFAAVLLVLSTSLMAQNEDAIEQILERLERLEKIVEEQSRDLAERDARIAELEQDQQVVTATPSAEPVSSDAAPVVVAESAVAQNDLPESVPDYDPPEYYGDFQSLGRGFKLANTPYGDMNFSLYTNIRYLNQKGLDETYTDAFGRTSELELRNDLMFQKVMLYFKGWVLDPKLRYMAYAWTTNTSQGLGSQVVIAGNLTYLFNDQFNLGVGIGGLPSTRSTEGNFPRWLKMDTRTMADDYFRGSFTSGIFAYGNLTDTLSYRAMLGNNLSQLGVDAGQLDNTMDTFSTALVWKPLGAYHNGFGDFEETQGTSVRFGLHYTHSTEDRQSQPGVDDPENTQLRLSDGTLLFRPGAFGTEGRINRARYQMTSLDAGIKHEGWALEAEAYYRWLDKFETEGFVPVSEVDDYGYQVQASAMLVPKTWQVYLAHSKIYGDYGDPWDAAVGVNWFPYESHQFRINGEFLYLKNSPVGNYSSPYLVGGNGPIFYVNAEYLF